MDYQNKMTGSNRSLKELAPLASGTRQADDGQMSSMRDFLIKCKIGKQEEF